MNNEMKVNSLRKHQEYVERVKAFNLSDPKSVSEAQKFLENAFKEVLDDFTSIKDRLLVFLMYYDFTKMNEFSYLKPFYGQTYERCFDTEEHIKTYFDLLVNNKELCDNVLENVNNETLKKLYDYSDSINHLFLMNNDKKYQDVYNKISKVCTEKRIVEAPLEIMDDSTLNRQELLKAKENNNISDDFYNAQIEEKRDNIFDKAADALGVKSDNLINFVGDESLKVDKIIISNELVNTLAANSAIISTKPNNKFNKMLKRISEINKFKGFEFSLVDNILTIKKEDTTLDKIASCSQKVFSTIKNSAIKKKKLAKLVINNTLDSIKNVKSAIINTNKKVTEYLSNLKNRNNIQEKKEDVNKETAPTEYEDIYSDSKYDPNVKDVTLDDLYKMTQEMDSKDANKVIEKATVNPSLSAYDFANNITGVTHMEQRQRNDWANESAFATMSDEELSDYNEKARLAAEKAKAEEIVRGRSR